MCTTYFYPNNKKINKLFYKIDGINSNLSQIDKYKEKILEETNLVYIEKPTGSEQSLWIEWPEKYLYKNPNGWTIYPFYAFGIWVTDNCKKCPTIYNFISNINGLKLATLSRLKPGIKLDAHQGWASHSNHVIRCHYGLVVQDNTCYINVEDLDSSGNIISEKKFHKKCEWLVFDDSKTHYAENSSESDRIVLILDIIRPENIEVGKSTIGDSKELLNIVEYFRKNNLIK